MQSLLGDNHHLPLFHMAKSFIWIEETKERINEFLIGYMINPTLNTDKIFKERVTKYMNTTFVAITKPHIITILEKNNTRVLELLMFYEKRNNHMKFFKVFSCVIHIIFRNCVCIDYLACELKN